jgi:hypothetical protein
MGFTSWVDARVQKAVDGVIPVIKAEIPKLTSSLVADPALGAWLDARVKGAVDEAIVQLQPTIKATISQLVANLPEEVAASVGKVIENLPQTIGNMLVPHFGNVLSKIETTAASSVQSVVGNVLSIPAEIEHLITHPFGVPLPEEDNPSK